MKKIKIYFVDFWVGFRNEENFIISTLRNHYQIIIDSKNPEYLFYSSFGGKHFQYSQAVKIYFSGENDIPDFNLCDYGISCSHLLFQNRHFRLPLYSLSENYNKLFQKSFSSEKVLKRKFCNFVYSNSLISDPIRETFFHRLSKYKKVDSGGKHLNNIGKPVINKLDFIQDYKFTIAFENSAVDGYTTEKIIDPMLVNSIPIYWGNSKINLDFNTQSFINVMNYQSIDEAIERIIFLDNNDEAYLEMLSQSWFHEEKKIDFKDELSRFLKNIIETPKDKSKHTTNYGFIQYYRKKVQIGNVLYKNKLLGPLLKKLI